MNSGSQTCLSSVRHHGRKLLIFGVVFLAIAAVLYLLSGGVEGIASATSRGDTRSRMWCFLGGLLMLLLGIFQLFQGVKHLLVPGNCALSKSIRSQLPPEQQTQSPNELFALVDRDLDKGHQTLLDGDLLAGSEWLLFKNGPILAFRYDHLKEVFLSRDKKKYILNVIAQDGKRANVTASNPDSCREALELLYSHAPQLAQQATAQ